MVNAVTVDALTLANELRPVLLRVARELRKETEQFGVTSRQVTLLWLVKQRPGLSLRELAVEEGVSPPAISSSVDRLERQGLLRRLRSAEDRRVRERRTAWLAERLDGLSPGELAAVEAAIEPLRGLL
jgi:transposase